MIVRLPSSSVLRAAPKKRFGLWRAFESTPPERILPEWGTTALCARASRVSLHVAVGGFVERRADHLALHGSLHVGDLLRPLVDEKHDQVDLGVIGRDRVRDLLQDDGLPGPGRRDDETALPLADRSQEVHEARRQIVRVVLDVDDFVRVERGEVVEERFLLGLLGMLAVDHLHLEEGEVPLGFLRRANLPGNGVAGPQIEFLDLRRRNVDVIGARQVVVRRRAEEPVPLGQDLENPLGEYEPVLLGLRLEDLEYDLLLPETREPLDIERRGDVDELLDFLGFQFRNIHHGQTTPLSLIKPARASNTDSIELAWRKMNIPVCSAHLAGRGPAIPSQLLLPVSHD